MRIQNNIMAMNTHRMYSINNTNIAKSAEKLSSGYRINRAGDDAAGLAISEKMRSQIRGLGMASKNSQDAISLVQTAEGALQEVHSMLQRMNELAVQAATGTNQEFDRMQLAKEFDQLKREINDISEQTTFNNMKVLDGSLSNEGPRRSAMTAGLYVSKGDEAVVGGITMQTSFIELDVTKLRVGDSVTLDGNTAVWGETSTISSFAAALVGGAGNLSTLTNLPATGGFVLNGNTIIKYSELGKDDDILVQTDIEFSPVTSVNHGTMRIQVGALENEQLNIQVRSMNTAGLQLDPATLDDQDKAGSAITATRAAIDKVSDQRSLLGAMQNRLEHKISNLDNTAENLSASESRIRDVDVAKEMTNFTKNNILAQAATAMLAQANAAPQGVLSLLQ